MMRGRAWLVMLLAGCASAPPRPNPAENKPIQQEPTVVQIEPAVAVDPVPAPRASAEPARAVMPTFEKLAAVPPPVRQVVASGALAVDAAFGTRGATVLTLGAGETELSGAVALADGSMLVVGHTGFGVTDACVAKLDAAGNVDKKYGYRGFARIGEYGAFGHALTVDARGRAVAAGYYYKAGAVQLVVGRVMPDGQLDPTFGQGGVVSVNFGGNDERPSAVIALTSGETLVIGNHASMTFDGTYIAAFDAEGKPSVRFGPTGMVFVDPLPGREFATRALVDGEGRIVLGGYSVTRKAGFIARVLGDGTLDPSFGDHGVASKSTWEVSSAWALALDSDGKLLLGGQSKKDTAIIVRVDANGQEDPTWGKAGVARGPEQSGDQLYALFPAADRSIVGVGFRGLANDARPILMKLGSSGARDTTFGSGGVLLGTTRGAFLSAGTVGANGSILGVGMRVGTAGPRGNGGNPEQIDGLAMRFVARP